MTTAEDTPQRRRDLARMGAVLLAGVAVIAGATFSAPSVAAGMVVPNDRQAGAQGVLGAAQALMAGIMAMITGEVYEAYGRTVAYAVVAASIFGLLLLGLFLARASWSLRQPEGHRAVGEGVEGV